MIRTRTTAGATAAAALSLLAGTAVAAPKAANLQLIAGAHVAVVSLLDPEVTHFHASRHLQNSFLKTYTLEWSVSAMLMEAVRERLTQMGLVPVAAVATEALRRAREGVAEGLRAAVRTARRRRACRRHHRAGARPQRLLARHPATAVAGIPARLVLRDRGARRGGHGGEAAGLTQSDRAAADRPGRPERGK